MDTDTKIILRQLHTAVFELSKISKTAYQTAHPTFNETTVQNLMAPIESSLAEVLQQLNENEHAAKSK